MDGQTDLTKLILALHIANAPKFTSFIIKEINVYTFASTYPED